MLLKVLSDSGFTSIDLGIASDIQEKLEEQVMEGISRADVLVTSGGVSMGELDLLKPILENTGTVHFGRVKIKPGKPVTFCTMDYEEALKQIFALPGNPVSSLVTFQTLAIPCLRKMMGYKNPNWPTVQSKVIFLSSLNFLSSTMKYGWSNKDMSFTVERCFGMKKIIVSFQKVLENKQVAF